VEKILAKEREFVIPGSKKGMSHEDERKIVLKSMLKFMVMKGQKNKSRKLSDLEFYSNWNTYATGTFNLRLGEGQMDCTIM
jgi:hypothetical protein